MPDEQPTLGEVVRRLERMEARQEELWRELTARKVDVDFYQRDRREDERRFVELERDLLQEIAAREKAVDDERRAREDGDKALANRMDSGGANWRQALYNGLLPSLFLLLTLAVTIWVAKGK